MTPERLRQIEDLYHSAREREPDARAAFLAEACQKDEELRREVESLLAFDPSSAALLEEPMREAAAMLASQQGQSQHQAGSGRGAMTGSSFGNYRLEEQIGKGGMGVVYRAVDAKLGRSVAIKVLPEECAKDPARRARFEREARLLAALEHRNIGRIYGFETAGDHCFLVLELIPGATLASRLAKDPPDISEALDICRQIAEALEAAHEKGIVHRDLKPANVKITPDGEVKVLDFGLAKALQPDSSGNVDELPTTTLDSTETGVVMGTAAYMSPEQARGQAVDKRTDIWAFGCVFYELLARRRVFLGDTTSDLLAAILKQEPDWGALPPRVPPNIVTLLKRCLQSDRRRRLRDIGDARFELEEALAAPPARAGTAQRKSSWAVVVAAAMIVGAALTGIGWALLRPSTPMPGVTRFAMPLGRDEIIAPVGSSVQLSPDGAHLAWAASDAGGRTQIFHRRLDDLQATALPGTATGSAPFFSPDGSSLAFLHAGSRTVKKLALSGGAPAIICPYDAGFPGAWSPSDDIYVTVQYPGTVVRVAASGGDPKPVTTLDTKREEVMHTRPVLLPGGRAILFAISGGGMDSYDDGRIALRSLETGERKILIEGGMAPQYSPTGHIIYAHDGKLLAVPFDLKRLAVTGSPVPVLEGVFMCVNTGSAHYSLAANGTLAYAPGVVLGGARQLVWVDRAGRAEALPIPARAYLHPRISPDNTRLAVEVEGPMHDFWVDDLARGIMTKVTTDGISHWPVWTPDGARFSYRRWTDGTFSMWWSPADRSATPERLTNIGRAQSPGSWSPDGRVVAFTQVNPETGADVYVLDMAGDRKPRPFVQTRYAEGSPKFSPDGRWIAYTSNESGHNEIYVQAYPGPGAKIQISVEGGTDAAWRPNGGELYYRDGDKMMLVQVSTSGAFQSSRPKLLWTGRYAHGLGS
jgi:predicted Ser/Thr protein kinase